jgi:hypothetical protein
MILEIIMWTLITVTNGGTVNESTHATQESCEQAKSIAQSGMTIEENKAAAEAYAAFLKKYEEDHPWRDPKDDFEKSIAKTGGSASWGASYSLAGDGHGHVREIPGLSISSSYNSNDVKYAKCIPPTPENGH